jgi:hypothetical protein
MNKSSWAKTSITITGRMTNIFSMQHSLGSLAILTNTRLAINAAIKPFNLTANQEQVNAAKNKVGMHKIVYSLPGCSY